MPEFIHEFSFRRLINSLKLTPKHRLVEFGGLNFSVLECFFSTIILFIFTDIWVEIFLWCFMTSVVTHFIASLLALQSLRNHKIGRWYAILIFLAGIITPMVSSTITSRNVSS